MRPKYLLPLLVLVLAVLTVLSPVEATEKTTKQTSTTKTVNTATKGTTSSSQPINNAQCPPRPGCTVRQICTPAPTKTTMATKTTTTAKLTTKTTTEASAPTTAKTSSTDATEVPTTTTDVPTTTTDVPTMTTDVPTTTTNVPTMTTNVPTTTTDVPTMTTDVPTMTTDVPTTTTEVSTTTTDVPTTTTNVPTTTTKVPTTTTDVPTTTTDTPTITATITEKTTTVDVPTTPTEPDATTAEALPKCKVTVYTGAESNADTHANVYITMLGTLGNSTEQRLNNGKDDNFKRGGVDIFFLECAYLGDLERINIRHDNMGNSPDWFLDKVLVENMENGQVYKFPCFKWLKTGGVDAALSRYLPVPDGICQSAVNKNKNVCYWAEEDWDTYPTTREKCTSKGGELAALNTKETSDFVIKFLESQSVTHLWIGYNERDDRWHDGSPFNWTNYNGSEPNDGTDFCTGMHQGYSWKWYDAPCSGSHQGLCQIHVLNDCLETYKGEGYMGTRNTTLDGLTCQAWSTNTPHTNLYTDPDLYPDATLEEASNYCRNPSGDPEGPWCYTTDPDVEYSFCDIPLCSQPPAMATPPTPPKDCLESDKGTDYVGHRSVTENDYHCQAWRAQVPHPHDDWNYKFPDGTMRDAANYCRNPVTSRGTREKPWCYTTHPAVEWDYCDLPPCEEH